MDSKSILDSLKRPGEFAAMAAAPDYLDQAVDPERVEAFAKAGVPDPTVIHGWWKGQLDLPKEEPNYGFWLQKNVLQYAGVPAGVHYTGTLKAEMERLEYLIRSELGIGDLEDPVPATEASPVPETPASPHSPEEGQQASD